MRSRELGEGLVQQPELVVAEGTRRDGDPLELVDHCLSDAGMTVPLVHGGVGRQAVEVPPVIDVPHPHAFTSAQHHIERPVVVGPELVFVGDELG